MSSRVAREVERRIFRLLHDRKTQTKLSEIHGHFLRQELHGSNLLLAHFVSICGIFKRMSYAHLIFQQTSNPNILLFNSMIKGYSVSGSSKESLNLYSLMKERGIWPDQYTFAPLLKSCSNISDLKFGQRVHAEILTVGFEAHNSIGIGLVELYTSCEKMEDAKRVFDWMSQRDVVIWNLMIRGFCKTGNVDMGLQSFRQMNERSIVSWNSMIAGLAQNGREFEAMEVFREMWDDGFEPDDATLVTILPVCAKLGDFHIGNWIHSYADSKGLSREVVAVGNSLVDFFCKSGDLETAQKIFNEMPRKSVISWNVMISGLAFNGEGELGLELFEKMKKHEHEPNGATFIGVLACCTHAGLVQKGRELFDSMTPEYKIKPNLQHHGCMVDLLGRSGCLKEAQELIQRMPMKPNAAIWGSLLSACRIHGDLELAEYASKELIRIEPWNSGNYVQLSNIYAELGKWDAVEKVRMMMNENNVLKDPGHSFI